MRDLMTGFVIDTPLPSTNGNGNGSAPSPAIDFDPAEIEALDAERLLAWAMDRFGTDLRIAVSFQKTSSVIVDMAHRINPDTRFFYVDTGRLFPETYETRDKLAERYGIEFERIGDESPAPLGANGCCADRKVELMQSALGEVDAWVSGIRRVDSPTRAEAPKFGWDARFGLWKLNPLADWDERRVWTYIKDHHVPYNALHDQGYPSIGCMPCTTVALEGAGERAGRWAGTDRTECGIHG